MASKFNLKDLKVDLKQLFTSQQVENLSKHLSGYEKRVKELVKELDLKSRDAREKSKEQLTRFAGQVKKTSTDVEKNVKDLLSQEGKVLNQKLNELVTYLKGLASNEKKAPVQAAPKAQTVATPTKAKSAKSAGAKKSSAAPRKRASKKASSEASASQA